MKTPQESTGALECAWSGGTSLPLGYGVPGLAFASGEILAFARALSPDATGPATRLWHRDSRGRWTSFRDRTRADEATAPDEDDPDSLEIRLHWSAETHLSLSIPERRLHWSLRLRATPRTMARTLVGLLLPIPSIRPGPAGSALERLLERLLDAAGGVQIPAGGSRGGPAAVDIQPGRVWSVEASAAVVEGRELGPARLPGEGAHRRWPSDQLGPRFVVGRARPARLAPSTA